MRKQTAEERMLGLDPSKYGKMNIPKPGLKDVVDSMRSKNSGDFEIPELSAEEIMQIEQEERRQKREQMLRYMNNGQDSSLPEKK